MFYFFFSLPYTLLASGIIIPCPNIHIHRAMFMNPINNQGLSNRQRKITEEILPISREIKQI